MTFFPSQIAPSNTKETDNDVASNSNIMNASDYNRHDEEIIALETSVGTTDSTLLSSLRGKVGGATRSMCGVDNSIIAKDAGLSNSGSSTVVVAPTEMFINGIYQANTVNAQIDGVDTDGFYIFYAVLSSTSTVPTFTFQRVAYTNATEVAPSNTQVSAVVDLIEADASDDNICLLGEVVRYNSGTFGTFTDYAINGIYDSGFQTSFTAVTVAAGATLVVPHNLGSLPHSIMIYYSNSATGADPIPVSYTDNGTTRRGALITAMSRKSLTVQVADGAVATILNGTGAGYTAPSGTPRYRVIAIRGRTQFFNPS